MHCLDCQTVNREQDATCVACGASLRPARAQLYLDHAEASINTGRYDEATAHMSNADREMLALNTDERDRYLLTARAFYLHSIIYYQRSLMDEAREELLLAQRSLEAHPDGGALLSNVLNSLGNVYYYQGRIDDAIECYRHSSEVGISCGANEVAARALGNEASMYISRGAIEQALALYQRSLEQAHLSGEPHALGQSYRVLAWMHSNYGSLNLARQYVEQALAISEQLDGVSSRGLVLIEASTVYLKRGELVEAENMLQEATDLLQRTGTRLLNEGVEVNMAELMRQRGDDAAWFSYATHAFNDAANNLNLQTESALQLTGYYIKHQDWVHARRLLQRLQSSVNEGEVNSDYNPSMLTYIEALIHSGMGEWEEAEQRFKERLNKGEPDSFDMAIMWQDYGEMLLRRAAAEHSPDVRKQAEEALNKAASMFSRFDLPQRAAAIEALLAAKELRRALMRLTLGVCDSPLRHDYRLRLALLMGNRASATRPYMVDALLVV